MEKLLPKKTSRADFLFDVTVTVLLFVIILAVAYPLYFVVIASVSNPSSVNSGDILLLPSGINFLAYEKIMSDNRIWRGYFNTIIYTFFGTFIGVFVTSLAGYSLSRKDLPGRNLIMGIFVFTMYFGGGLIPTYMVVNSLKLINTPYVMILMGSFSVFNMIIARSYFAGTISQELLEAAQIDGCGNGYFFFGIVVPLSKAILAVLTLYYAVGHWNSFFTALIYLRNNKLYPLQLILRDILITSQLVQNQVTDIESIGYAEMLAETIKYGVIIVSSLPVLIMYPFVQKYFVKGVMIGAIKG